MIADAIVLGFLAIVLLMGFARGISKSLGGFLRGGSFFLAAALAFLIARLVANEILAGNPDASNFLGFLNENADLGFTIIVGLGITIAATIVLVIIGKVLKSSQEGKQVSIISRLIGAIVMTAIWSTAILALLGLAAGYAENSFVAKVVEYINNETSVLKAAYDINPFKQLFG